MKVRIQPGITLTNSNFRNESYKNVVGKFWIKFRFYKRISILRSIIKNIYDRYTWFIIGEEVNYSSIGVKNNILFTSFRRSDIIRMFDQIVLNASNSEATRVRK